MLTMAAHYGYGFFWFGPLLFFGLFFLFFAFAGRRWRKFGPMHHGPGHPTAIDILEERFARGEIDATELRARRQELLPKDEG